MQGQGTSSWTVSGNDVTLEDLELPDGRMIGALVEIDGRWDDGAFDYEYGSIRGTHRYPVQYELDSWQILKVWDMATEQEIQLDQVAKAAIDKEMDAISGDIGEKMEPDEPDYPEPDDR